MILCWKLTQNFFYLFILRIDIWNCKRFSSNKSNINPIYICGEITNCVEVSQIGVSIIYIIFFSTVPWYTAFGLFLHIAYPARWKMDVSLSLNKKKTFITIHLVCPLCNSPRNLLHIYPSLLSPSPLVPRSHANKRIQGYLNSVILSFPPQLNLPMPLKVLMVRSLLCKHFLTTFVYYTICRGG